MSPQVSDVKDVISKTLVPDSTELDVDPDLHEGEGGLLRFAPVDAHVDEPDNQQDDEWRNWRLDDPEPGSFDEWDEDDGPLTPSNHSNSRRYGVAQKRIHV